MSPKTKQRKTSNEKRKTKSSKGLTIPIFNSKGKEVEKYALDKDFFTGEVNKKILYQALLMYNANQRSGTASTKTRSDVSGGGKKPWRQKGTGRARAGSIRSPLWRGGGIIFGPRVRDFRFTMPKKMVRQAIISGLSAKTRDKEIIVLEKDPEFGQPKTKEMAKILKALKTYRKKVLFLCSDRNENLIKSSRNIENLTMRSCSDFSVYDVLTNSKILFSRETCGNIVKRLKK